MRVLVIEDNITLSNHIVRFLSSRDIFSKSCYDGKKGLYEALVGDYDIIILDINLPGLGGFEVCKKIREKHNNVGIIMLTSLSDDENIVKGLELGADDYLAKPFEYNILLARMNAIIRRNSQTKCNTIYEIEDLVIDLQRKKIVKNGDEIILSKLEFKLFEYFIKNRGIALSRDEIYLNVWGETKGEFLDSKTIDVYVGYLRKKLGKHLIETKFGYGFIMI